MAVEIVMPKLGWTMEEGILVEWLKRDGDAVQPGDILFLIESDKALNEVESFEAGILRIPPDSDALGKPLPVGALLAYIVQPGEAPPFEMASNVSVGTRHASSENAAPELTTPVGTTQGEIDQTRTRRASSLQPAPNGELPTISPRARRVAAELGVEWATLIGSGRTGRIVERDVRAAASIQEPHPPTPSPFTERGRKEVRSELMETPLTHREQSSVEGFAVSRQASTSISLTTEADATELVDLYRRIGAARLDNQQPMPTFDDLLAKLTAAALEWHPQLDARVEAFADQLANGAIRAIQWTKRAINGPLKRIAAEKGLDLSRIKGSGLRTGVFPKLRTHSIRSSR